MRSCVCVLSARRSSAQKRTESGGDIEPATEVCSRDVHTAPDVREERVIRLSVNQVQGHHPCPGPCAAGLFGSDVCLIARPCASYSLGMMNFFLLDGITDWVYFHTCPAYACVRVRGRSTCRAYFRHRVQERDRSPSLREDTSHEGPTGRSILAVTPCSDAAKGFRGRGGERCSTRSTNTTP